MNRIAKRIERYRQIIKTGDLVYVIAKPRAPVHRQIGKDAVCGNYRDYRDVYLDSHKAALFLGWAEEIEWSGSKTMKVLFDANIYYVNARRVLVKEDFNNFHKAKKEYEKLHGEED